MAEGKEPEQEAESGCLGLGNGAQVAHDSPTLTLGWLLCCQPQDSQKVCREEPVAPSLAGRHWEPLHLPGLTFPVSSPREGTPDLGEQRQ